jgi:hypothetical protein
VQQQRITYEMGGAPPPPLDEGPGEEGVAGDQ